MHRSALAVCCLLLLSACTGQQGKRPLSGKGDTLAQSRPAGQVTGILETFTDSVRIGIPGRSKVELIRHRVLADQYIIVKFLQRTQSGWSTRNNYAFECGTDLPLDPDISDYNHDGWPDLTFISATAARGANEVRRLFIYDAVNESLLAIVNAEEYPNLRYNAALDCIDAMLFHGGTTTVFARLEGDRLRTFAEVHSDSHRTVYEADDHGNMRQISKEPIVAEDIYIRYCNYKPLLACPD